MKRAFNQHTIDYKKHMKALYKDGKLRRPSLKEIFEQLDLDNRMAYWGLGL